MPESLIITFFVLKRKTSKKCSHLSTWCSKTINQMKGSTSFVFLIDIKILEIMHLSMLSPRGGGGGTPGICGAFDLYCLPHPREFD